jgi:hypothetical protein
MKIIGGRSQPRSITLASFKFSCKASLKKDGSMHREIKRQTRITSWISNWGNTQKGLLVMCSLGSFAVGNYSYELLQMIRWLHEQELLTHKARESFFWATTVFVLLLTEITFICATLSHKIKKMHGAEHMAVAYFNRTGTYDIDGITKEDRLHHLCGSRFLVPGCFFLAAVMFIWSLAYADIGSPALLFKEYLAYFRDQFPNPIDSSINLRELVESAIGFLLSFVYAACPLGMAFVVIDLICPWSKIPPFSHATRLLQKHVLTAPPGETELKLASYAVEGLVQAHKEAEQK